MTAITEARTERQARTEKPHSQRLAALGGFLFVVLGIGSTVLQGKPPATDSPAAKVADYFRAHPGNIRASQLVGALGIVGLLWWFGAVSRTLRRDSDVSDLTTVAAVALTSAVTLAMVSGTALATAALRIDSLGTDSQLLWTLSFVVMACSGLALTAFLASACTANARARVFPTWTNYAGWTAALAFLVSGLGIVTDANAFFIFGFVAFFAWCVWIVGVSLAMWREA